MWRRLLFDVLLLILIFVLPWWITLLLGIAGAFYFNNFFELAVLGGVFDVLFGSSVSLFNFEYMFLLLTLVLVLGIENVKGRLVMY